MTEDEAKKKWCPFARGEDPAGANRWSGIPARPNMDSCACLGSACMVWRWENLIPYETWISTKE